MNRGSGILNGYIPWPCKPLTTYSPSPLETSVCTGKVKESSGLARDPPVAGLTHRLRDGYNSSRWQTKVER